jgi:thiazole synthase ThiGH ThiG subunit
VLATICSGNTAAKRVPEARATIWTIRHTRTAYGSEGLFQWISTKDFKQLPGCVTRRKRIHFAEMSRDRVERKPNKLEMTINDCFSIRPVGKVNKCYFTEVGMKALQYLENVALFQQSVTTVALLFK